MNDKFYRSIKGYAFVVCSALALSSCSLETEDPGPIQQTERDFIIEDFDRLEMGSPFNIRVEKGDHFEVKAEGDRRNIDDLIVRKAGSTLVIRYDNFHNRRHSTYITVTMPVLSSVNFSGASDSRISGFDSLESLDVYLSGASISTIDAVAKHVDIVLSGASHLTMVGNGEALIADVSGASVLKSYNFVFDAARLSISGASGANVTVNNSLKVIASGASVVRYRGNPAVTSDVSGASSVRHD
jgi:hypothetical protein